MAKSTKRRWRYYTNDFGGVWRVCGRAADAWKDDWVKSAFSPHAFATRSIFHAITAREARAIIKRGGK